jgi:outer membrane protein assembly factor BamB
MARGNPQRTGNIDAQAGPKAPKLLWVYKSPEHYVASPTPGCKAIYVTGIGAFGTGVIHAVSTELDALERVLWSKTAPFIRRPIVSAPAVVDGWVLFGDGMHQTDDAMLYCLRAEDGLPVWQYPITGKLIHIESSPVVDGNLVYVCGGEAGVLCLDMKRVVINNREQDSQSAIAHIERRWAELQARYEQEKEKNPQLAIPPNETSLPIPQAKLVWWQGQGKWHIDAPPLVVGEYLLVASAYLEQENVGKRCLLCLKKSDGGLVWETPLEINPWAGPTVAGRVVLVGCSSIRFDRRLIGQAKGEVVAVDLVSGQVRWRHPTPGGVLAAVAVKGEAAVFTTTGGQVIARHCGTGKLLWQYDAGKPFFAGAAIASDTVYAADLTGVVHALRLADGYRQWTFDVCRDPAVQARGMIFGAPLVHGGELFLTTCNLDAETEEPAVIVCLSDRAKAAHAPSQPVVVDKQGRKIIIPCRIAPRKLPNLSEIYPLEVVATYPAPRGQKAHETVVTFDCKPSEIHRALESMGLKPGKPARGESPPPSGPEVKVYLELPDFAGKWHLVPVERTIIDKRTAKPLPPLRWYFTGSALRQIDPDREEYVYGADLSGTLLTFFPVTDETVIQANLALRDSQILILEMNRNLLPPEGTEVRLIIEAK